MIAAPRSVIVTRSEYAESQHIIHGIAVDSSGEVVDRFGDVDQMIYPRSALKPFQALPLLISGAADQFDLSDEALALACASHNGETQHVNGVTGWLEVLGLESEDLGCGAELPVHPPAAHALLRNRESPTRTHNTCSGKHAGMLTLCRHLGAPIDSYLNPDHPVQRLIADQVRTQFRLERLEPPARDGCGAPIWRVPLSSLARAVAELAAGPAGRRLFDAMTTHPFLVAGTDRLCTDVMQADSDIVVKTGAEGVFIALIRSSGIAVALKVADGASRAADVALIAQLDALGATRPGDTLERWRNETLLNSRGDRVGSVRPGDGWKD